MIRVLGYISCWVWFGILFFVCFWLFTLGFCLVFGVDAIVGIIAAYFWVGFLLRLRSVRFGFLLFGVLTCLVGMCVVMLV